MWMDELGDGGCRKGKGQGWEYLLQQASCWTKNHNLRKRERGKKKIFKKSNPEQRGMGRDNLGGWKRRVYWGGFATIQ